MDMSLIIGIVLGFGSVIVGYILEHGVLQSLFLGSSLIIVLGGTMGATIASFAIKDTFRAFRSVASTFRSKHAVSTEKIIMKISEVSEVFRREGMLALDKFINGGELDSQELLLLKEGLILIQSNKTPEEIQYTMESDIRAFTQRRQIEINVWEAAAGYSPTMGIIGTVMGLILVLASGFEDPEKLAASIATAFVCTLYGVLFANLIYLPIASKLKSDLRKAKILRELIVDGVCMIAKRNASRDVENALSLYYQAFADGDKKYKAGIGN